MPEAGPGRDTTYGDYHDWAVDELWDYIAQLHAALKSCDVYGIYAQLLSRANRPFLGPEDE